MRVIDLIEAIEATKRYDYNIDRQCIYHMNGHDVDIGECKVDDEVAVEVADFDTNVVIAKMRIDPDKHCVKKGMVVHGNEWLFEELTLD